MKGCAWFSYYGEEVSAVVTTLLSLRFGIFLGTRLSRVYVQTERQRDVGDTPSLTFKSMLSSAAACPILILLFLCPIRKLIGLARGLPAA